MLGAMCPILSASDIFCTSFRYHKGTSRSNRPYHGAPGYVACLGTQSRYIQGDGHITSSFLAYLCGARDCHRVGAGLYDCTRLLLWLGTELRVPGMENNRLRRLGCAIYPRQG